MTVTTEKMSSDSNMMQHSSSQWTKVSHGWLGSVFLSSASVDDVAGLAKDDAEKQYVLVVKRLTDIYGI